MLKLVESGKLRCVRNSLVLLAGEDRMGKWLLIARDFLLLVMSSRIRTRSLNFAFLQYMECPTFLKNDDAFQIAFMGNEVQMTRWTILLGI